MFKSLTPKSASNFQGLSSFIGRAFSKKKALFILPTKSHLLSHKISNWTHKDLEHQTSISEIFWYEPESLS